VAGQKLDRFVPGNDIRHVFLADRRHLGTLGHGMLARYFIVTVNLRFRAGIPALTDRELLACAAGSTAPPPERRAARLTRLVNRPNGPDARGASPEAK
jgi:hypothetical protein